MRRGSASAWWPDIHLVEHFVLQLWPTDDDPAPRGEPPSGMFGRFNTEIRRWAGNQ